MYNIIIERSVFLVDNVMETKTKKGFTLIELLVVIAILAVLATAVVIILNPAQLVKQGRDSTRISDLAAVHSAIALYLSEVPGLTSWTPYTYCTNETAGSKPTGFDPCTYSSSTAVNGTGWVPVNFGAISSGSPLSRLPMDPVNDATYFYAFKSSSTLLYELDAKMESNKYGSGGAGDIVSNTKDGGNDNNWYEVGNAPALNL